LSLLNKFQTYYKAEKTRFLKFAVVGISGVIVNEGLLALLTEILTIRVAIAGAIAIEVSILSNFILNNFWTWQDSHDKSFLKRLIQYHSVSIIAGLVNYVVLVGLTHLGLHHLIANLIGIAFATLINFVLNNHWTFAKKLSEEME
jgi:dolichol-phosphate mannosyltransferase